MKEQIIKNAWRKTGYEWFPKDDEITEAAVTFTEEDEEIAGVLDVNLEEQELPHYIF